MYCENSFWYYKKMSLEALLKNDNKLKISSLPTTEYYLFAFWKQYWHRQTSLASMSAFQRKMEVAWTGMPTNRLIMTRTSSQTGVSCHTDRNLFTASESEAGLIQVLGCYSDRFSHPCHLLALQRCLLSPPASAKCLSKAACSLYVQDHAVATHAHAVKTDSQVIWFRSISIATQSLVPRS